MQLKHLGISLVFLLAAAQSPADPGRRETVRAFYLESIAQDRSVQQDEFQQQAQQRQEEHRRMQEFAMPESSGYGGPSDNAGTEQRRSKPGRMSPEERRALRRQIDEAGHDIYTPKH